jgi:GT2 family glycosyltransferase/SAM-dependent methyltransferase
VSAQRRAGAPRLIEWTGERCVPWAPNVQVVYEHYHRYLWAAPLVSARTVLDLGSGEGFGSAILSDTAAHVTGVDLDERTVEHSRLNYSGANLRFEVGSALDLSRYEDGSFGAVVAFEIIEHVQDQERVLSEVARVLSEDGLLVISTPDRRAYSEASGQVNPFHARELALEEFSALLEAHFPHLATWGQRTITGSHLNGLGASADASGPPAAGDFYIERAGEEWRIAGEPAPLYCVAVASRAALPSISANSTLADCGLELLRAGERERAESVQRAIEEAGQGEQQELRRAIEAERAERIRAEREHQARLREEIEQRDRDIAIRGEDIDRLNAEMARRDERSAEQRAALASLEGELADARARTRRIEESVTWSAFERLRDRLYGTIGERSLLARALSMSLRLAGRAFIGRPAPPPEPPAPEIEASEEPEVFELPEFEHPKVSLIIPVHARADLTRACLESIRRHTTHVSYEVIVVDDAADRDTGRLLAGLRGAKVIVNEKNLGYIRSMNRGTSAARGDWLVLCNNDIEVTEGWLQAMLECAQSAEDVGVVTPKFVYPDGTLNEAGGIIWRDGTGANYGRGDPPALFQYEYRRETDYGSAAALMVRAELWRAVGGFDERYLPMYYEDVDICFQARERGLRVLYEPDAVVIHLEGATAGTDADSGHKRHQEENRPKFRAKWHRRLEAENLPPAAANTRRAANRQRGPHVLVIDHCVPRWDRDAGSLRMLYILRALLEHGARVSFMAENLSAVQPYTRRLQRMGVEVLYGQLDVNAELATIGPYLTAAILSRPHPASRWLDAVREFAPGATVVYDTVDLHWLREARKDALARHDALASSSVDPRAASNGSVEVGSLEPKAKALRELELAMIRAADVTLLVSESEQAQVLRDVPDANTLLVPTVHELDPNVLPPEGRAGVLFLGGFAHPPNIGAAIHLVKDVMPAVWRELPDLRVTIVGSDAPPEVQALASPRVDVAGWVEDLQPVLDRARVLVVPLRYGAGLKGKIMQCLAAGLPVVTTPVGVEGIDGLERCTLVGEKPVELAAHVVRVCRDDELWRELSRAGQALVEEHCAPAVVSSRVRELVDTPGASAATAARE